MHFSGFLSLILVLQKQHIQCFKSVFFLVLAKITKLLQGINIHCTICVSSFLLSIIMFFFVSFKVS